jgi:hypothetical protein
VNPKDLFHDPTVEWISVGPICERSEKTPNAPNQICLAQEAILQGLALQFHSDRLRPQHESRKIHFPPVRGGVGTVVEAQLALVAEIRDTSQVRGSELFRFPVHRLLVETAEEIIE